MPEDKPIVRGTPVKPLAQRRREASLKGARSRKRMVKAQGRREDAARGKFVSLRAVRDSLEKGGSK